MRKYQETHPWITFQLDMRKATPRLWMALGEAQSKCEHIAGVPLRPITANELHKVFLAKGVLATTAIEGNTLSEKEVLEHLEGKLELPPSKEYLAQEITNIVAACNRIRDRMIKGEPSDLTVTMIKEFNQLVLEKLSMDAGVIPGELRQHSVTVARYRGAPAEDCEYLLENMCQWLNAQFQSSHRERIVYGILKAVMAHLYLAWIHPFGDGNGRTARLIEFQVLLEAGVPTPAVHLLSNHYNQTRREYYVQLDRASKSGGDPLPFIEYAVQGFVDGLKSQLELIRDQQLEVAWENYIHEEFHDMDSRANVRRRHLVLDLSLQKNPVGWPEIRQISPRMAEAYANKTSRTIIRDLNFLMEMGLVKVGSKGWMANKELMLAFLPARRMDD